MIEKRFKVSDGTLYEYNGLIDAWHEVDLEKICNLLNNLEDMYDEFIKNMWLEKR